MKKIIITILAAIATIGVAKADNERHIPVDKLPAQAIAFIDAHFDKTKILFSIEEREFFGTEYEVMFDDRTSVEFDGKGNLKKIESRMPIDKSLVPSAINDFIEGRYPQIPVLEISKDKYEWEVKLANGIELEFDTNFNLIGYDD